MSQGAFPHDLSREEVFLLRGGDLLQIFLVMVY